MKRIQSLKESPCYNCGCMKECNKKVAKNFKLREVVDKAFPDASFNYHDCGIWIALNAPEMIEVEDED